MGKIGAMRGLEDSLAIRAAWLHYTGGLTQAEVAARLGVSTAKAHRLIALAMQRGAVRIIVEGDVVECIDLEVRLSERFGLAEAHVVPDLGEADLPLRALGAAGARFLEREVARPEVSLIGLGHGRTLSAVVAALPQRDLAGMRFVSLMGGLTRNYVATSHDVMHALTGKTGAEAYIMPVPFFANSAQDRDVLLAQRGVRDVFGLAASAHLMVVGIGTTEPDAHLVAARMIEPSEIADVQRMGATGELLGHFFDRGGQVVETTLSARTLSPELAVLAGRRIVAIAGGDSKTRAILSVLESGLLSGLITDERTARGLLGDTLR